MFWLTLLLKPSQNEQNFVTSPLNLCNSILGSFGFTMIVGAMIGSDGLLIGGNPDRFNSSASSPDLVILPLLVRTVSTSINSNSRDAELYSQPVAFGFLQYNTTYMVDTFHYSSSRLPSSYSQLH